MCLLDCLMQDVCMCAAEINVHVLPKAPNMCGWRTRTMLRKPIALPDGGLISPGRHCVTRTQSRDTKTKLFQFLFPGRPHCQEERRLFRRRRRRRRGLREQLVRQDHVLQPVLQDDRKGLQVSTVQSERVRLDV